ncbi:uncharacterized protein LOC111494314 isoform X2 [Cucurbita maxima]|uniref:Uncharacterized protein LOC111494314 isoform X2 n=1 Tax=Cucurbita maxima TaxID=3661 RepID=A0A6J1KCA8_CUCMA|nr:uncharacterized protein LOC111494314 isoform X2 [Cucurbita maxima]
MVKPGTLTKLKSAMKRWPSIAKLGRTSSSVSVATVSDSGAEGENISSELHTVYVGGAVVISCEVVMFEHLLWMLENSAAQLSSTEELVEFYTC